MLKKCSNVNTHMLRHTFATRCIESSFKAWKNARNNTEERILVKKGKWTMKPIEKE